MIRFSYHVINHPTLAPDRRKWMVKQATQSHIDLNFFKCITPADVPSYPHEYNESRTRWRHGRALKATELACAFSHIQLWKQLLESSEDYFIILEDDVGLDPDLDHIVKSSLGQKQGNLIRLNSPHYQPHTETAKLPTGHRLVRYRMVPLTTGGYIISRCAAEVLISFCFRIHTAIDEMMRRTWEYGIANYGIIPYPVVQDPQFESVIGSRDVRYDHNNPLMKGYSRLCRWNDQVKKRLIVPRN